jgi:hypothetical protein
MRSLSRRRAVLMHLTRNIRAIRGETRSMTSGNLP